MRVMSWLLVQCWRSFGGCVSILPAFIRSHHHQNWSGLRPRPEGRPAPIIGHLPGYSNVLLATGHYRNGVLTRTRNRNSNSRINLV
jgi:hypothetical protein